MSCANPDTNLDIYNLITTAFNFILASGLLREPGLFRLHYRIKDWVGREAGRGLQTAGAIIIMHHTIAQYKS